MLFVSIKNPIFIVGSGRSGTTILYNLLSIHPQVGWFSNYTNRFPTFPELAIAHKLLDLPWVGSKLKQNIINNNKFRFGIVPSEGENIYHDYCGFEKTRKSTEEDLSEKQVHKFKTVIKKHLKMSDKKRFLTKQTANNQRIELINSIFPDALFIYLIRDGRAVTRSLLNVDWWDDMEFWHREGTPSGLTKNSKVTNLELAALHWKINVEEILSHKNLLEGRYKEIKYKDLTNKPRSVIENLLRFCDLSSSEDFFDLIPTELPNMNYKWKEAFSEQQKEELNELIGEFLKNLVITCRHLVLSVGPKKQLLEAFYLYIR